MRLKKLSLIIWRVDNQIDIGDPKSNNYSYYSTFCRARAIKEITPYTFHYIVTKFFQLKKEEIDLIWRAKVVEKARKKEMLFVKICHKLLRKFRCDFCGWIWDDIYIMVKKDCWPYAIPHIDSPSSNIFHYRQTLSPCSFSLCSSSFSYNFILHKIRLIESLGRVSRIISSWLHKHTYLYTKRLGRCLLFFC